MSSFALTAFRGDTIRLLATTTRPNATTGVMEAVNLTGLTGNDLSFTAKRKRKDADVDAVAVKTIGAGIAVQDAAAGELVVTLAPADTDALAKPVTLECDVQMIEADGTVTTVASGTLAIALDVTREAS